MAKEKIKMIQVETLPNGYGLKFDGMTAKNGYMYFTAEKLLEGFMAHIGLGMTDQLNTETIQDFLVTAINWRDNKACVKEIERLTNALRLMTGRRASLARLMIQERNKYNTLLDDVKSFRSELKDHPDQSLLKKFDKMMKDYKSMPKLSLEGLGVKDDDFIKEETEETDDDV